MIDGALGEGPTRRVRHVVAAPGARRIKNRHRSTLHAPQQHTQINHTTMQPDLASRLEKRLEFEGACKELTRVALAGDDADINRLVPIAKRAHALLKARHTSIGAWRAGLALFNALGAAADPTWAADARAFLGEDDDDDDAEGGGGGGGPSTSSERPPETLAEAIYGREAAEEMRRRRAAAMPVLTDVGLAEPPRPVLAAAAAAAPTATTTGGLQEARRLLMEQLEAAMAGQEGGGGAEEEGQPQQQQDEQHQRRLMAALAAALGASEREADDDDLQAALLASRLEAEDLNAAQQQARPPASRRVLAALPTRTIGGSDDDEKTSETSDGPAATTCSICCEPWRPGDVVQTLLPGCGHEFHRDCLSPWLGAKSNACPLCRAELPTDDHAYEARKERERDARDEAAGAANALKGGDFMYV